jgi:hypothetical protein
MPGEAGVALKAAFWLALALLLALACAKPTPSSQSSSGGWWAQQRLRRALASAEESAAPVVEGSYDFVDIRVFYRTIPLDYEQGFLADKAPGACVSGGGGGGLAAGA